MCGWSPGSTTKPTANGSAPSPVPVSLVPKHRAAGEGEQGTLAGEGGRQTLVDVPRAHSRGDVTAPASQGGCQGWTRSGRRPPAEGRDACGVPAALAGLGGPRVRATPCAGRWDSGKCETWRRPWCPCAPASRPGPTLAVAMVTRSTLAWALRSTWWLPEALVKISTPSRPMAMCGLRAEAGEGRGRCAPNPPAQPRTLSGVSCLHGPRPRLPTVANPRAPGWPGKAGPWRRGSGRADLCGVQSSSQISLPMQVSRVASTASPKGTVSCRRDRAGGRGHPSGLRAALGPRVPRGPS